MQGVGRGRSMVYDVLIILVTYLLYVHTQTCSVQWCSVQCKCRQCLRISSCAPDGQMASRQPASLITRAQQQQQPSSKVEQCRNAPAMYSVCTFYVAYLCHIESVYLQIHIVQCTVVVAKYLHEVLQCRSRVHIVQLVLHVVPLYLCVGCQLRTPGWPPKLQQLIYS